MTTQTPGQFTQYRRKQIAELQPWVSGYDMQGVSVSAEDAKAGSPKAGDMIARNPKNHSDKWLVAAAYFADNFEPAHTNRRATADVTEATHRHVKRGTEYVLIGVGKMQAEHWTENYAGNRLGVDMREVSIYRSATDPTEIWVRPREEFEDGRFIALNPPMGR